MSFACLVSFIIMSFFIALPAGAADYATDITAGSGQELSYTLSGVDTLTGNAAVNSGGSITLHLHDSAYASGSMTAAGYSGGSIFLYGHGNSHIAGNFVAQNGGMATIELNDRSVFSGNITVQSSGGAMSLAISDYAVVSGQVSSGSNSATTVTMKNYGRLTGGVQANSGGNLYLTMADNAYLAGNIQGIGNGYLYILAQDNSSINGPVSMEGQSTVIVGLTGNASLNSGMSATGSGSLDIRAYDSATIRGDLFTSGGGSSALLLNGSASMIGNITNEAGGQTSATLNGNSWLTGDLSTGGGAASTLTLSDNSVYTGSSVGQWGTVNVTLGGSSAWNLTQAAEVSQMGLSNYERASVVSSLDMADDSWVYMGAKNYTMASYRDRVQLDVSNLSGTGNFELRPFVNGIGSSATTVGDVIYVATNTGNHNIYVPSKELGLGGARVDGTEAFKVVHSLDGGGNFSLYQGRSVDIGPYSYKLEQIDKHWYLVAGEVVDTDDGDGDGGLEIFDPDQGFFIDPIKKPELNASAEASAAFMGTNYLINYIEMQTLLERMGDLRHTRQSDLWARGFGGQLSSFDFSDVPARKVNYYGIQAGIDGRLTGISDNLFVGVMGGYTYAEPKNRSSESNTKSYHLGAYGLWGTEDDFYVDLILKFSHIRAEYDVKDSQGAHVTGRGSSDAISTSLEVGKRFYLAEQRSGFYLEPQVQGAYTEQRKMDFTASNGLYTKMNGYDSVLLRGSLLAGYNAKGGDIPIDVYAKAGYIRELKGELDVEFNDVHHDTYRFRGGWWDYGLGVTAEIAGSHSLYVELGYSDGTHFDNKRINAGYRFSF